MSCTSIYFATGGGMGVCNMFGGGVEVGYVWKWGVYL